MSMAKAASDADFQTACRSPRKRYEKRLRKFAGARAKIEEGLGERLEQGQGAYQVKLFAREVRHYLLCLRD